MDQVIERFTPSPTGALHLGHALSALTGWEAAQRASGTFLLRMEDLDPARCKAQFAQAIMDDLRWLGLRWPEPILYQSTLAAAHHAVINQLTERGLTYRCFCTRAEIQRAVGAPQEGAEQAPAYPGTCRRHSGSSSGLPFAVRLDLRKAIADLGGSNAVRKLHFVELGEGPAGECGSVRVDPDDLVKRIGDIVLHRKDGAIAYHLAVVLDDARQDITHVTRGADLYSSTPLHRILQALTGSRTPSYRHHRLIRDPSGRRLAKRDGDHALATLRAAGATPADIRLLLRPY